MKGVDNPPLLAEVLFAFVQQVPMNENEIPSLHFSQHKVLVPRYRISPLTVVLASGKLGPRIGHHFRARVTCAADQALRDGSPLARTVSTSSRVYLVAQTSQKQTQAKE